jgi:hypothetical protein
MLGAGDVLVMDNYRYTGCVVLLPAASMLRSSMLHCCPPRLLRLLCPKHTDHVCFAAAVHLCRAAHGRLPYNPASGRTLVAVLTSD